MAQQALFTPNRALDANAYAQPGATATFYASGTMTLITVYSDEAGTIATTNPVVADGNGIFPQTFFDGDAKVIVRDADGATLWTVDPCPATSGDVTGAANVSFNPTVDLPFTNVQAAVEGAAALSIAGAADFGLGITGNAPTIGNIDATAQASGVFRFTGASTGTFPAGITASTTGLVQIDRQTAAEAVQTLRAAGGSRVYYRFLSASTYGPWLEMPTPLADPNADRIRGWDDSAGAEVYFTPGTGFAISGTTIAVANPVAAMANFNGNVSSGTYTRTGTLITVTLTAHGMATGHFASLDFTSGGGSDGYYQITNTGANTFTVVDAVSGTTSGNVTRNIWTRKSFNISNIVRVGGGRYTATFATAMPDADFIFVGHAGEVTNRVTEAVSINALGTLPTTTTVTFYTGPTGADGIPSTAAIDNGYVHFVVYA